MVISNLIMNTKLIFISGHLNILYFLNIIKILVFILFLAYKKANTKGTVLFFEVYQQFGVQVTEQLVRLFSTLKVKSTAYYLEDIKKNIGKEVSHYIEEKLLL